MRETYGAEDIWAAADGSVSREDLWNWVRSGFFNTRLPDPPSGRAREYPLFAVYEAVLLRLFANYGVPLGMAKRWNARIIAEIKRRGAAPDSVVFFPAVDTPLFVDEALPVGDPMHPPVVLRLADLVRKIHFALGREGQPKGSWE